MVPLTDAVVVAVVGATVVRNGLGDASCAHMTALTRVLHGTSS